MYVQADKGHNSMAILNSSEREFLSVFLHEATTSPFFRGPASEALRAIGVEYRDLSYLAWAYEQDVPRTSFEIGHAAETAPPLPWPSREAVLRRDNEIRLLWTREHEGLATSTPAG
jgi:hypothetical protein